MFARIETASIKSTRFNAVGGDLFCGDDQRKGKEIDLGPVFAY